MTANVKSVARPLIYTPNVNVTKKMTAGTAKKKTDPVSRY